MRDFTMDSAFYILLTKCLSLWYQYSIASPWAAAIGNIINGGYSKGSGKTSIHQVASLLLNIQTYSKT